MASEVFYGTGRRKTSTARVFIQKGKGKITVNKERLDKYSDRETARMIGRQPREWVELINKVDVRATVKGSGEIGRASCRERG